MGGSCGRTKAGTLMKLARMSAKQKRKFKATTDSKHNLLVTLNLLERKFEVSGPDRFCCADMTYIWTAEGWLYLAIVLDLFFRQIVGWAMIDRMKKELVINSLQMAF